MTVKKTPQVKVSAVKMRAMNALLRECLTFANMKPKTLRTIRGLAYKVLIEGSGSYRAEDKNYFSYSFAIHIENNEVVEMYWSGPPISMNIVSDNYVHVPGKKDIMQRFRNSTQQETYKVRRALEIMHKRAEIAKMLQEVFVGVVEKFEESLEGMAN